LQPRGRTPDGVADRREGERRGRPRAGPGGRRGRRRLSERPILPPAATVAARRGYIFSPKRHRFLLPSAGFEAAGRGLPGLVPTLEFRQIVSDLVAGIPPHAVTPGLGRGAHREERIGKGGV